MSDPFIGEIRIFAGNFAPRGWALCNGQLLPISQNTALFSLLGTTYGGDGRTNFALPNLQSRAPLHPGQGPGLSDRQLGEMGGQENVTLLTTQMPSHTHGVRCSSAIGDQTTPGGNVWAAGAGRRGQAFYANAPGTNPPAMSAAAIGVAGGDQPHNNLPPYLTLTFIIALQGIFPPRG